MQTLPADQPIQNATRPIARCTGSQEQPATLCPTRHGADGFLKYRFLPLYEIAETLPDQTEVEEGFFKSLSHLNSFYGLETLDVADKPYPYNILLTQSDIQLKIKTKGRYRDLQVNRGANGIVRLSIVETLDTSRTLYYIPVVKLYQAFQNGNAASFLLLSVCSYLYQIAGVPYYRDEECYLYYNYEILENWIEDDRESMDKEEYQQQRRALDEAFKAGEEMQTLMLDQKYLEQLGQRVQEFKPQNPFEKSCLELANATLHLWQEFPTANLYTHVVEPKPNEEDEDGYGEDRNYIGIGEYISFIAGVDDSLYDSMMEMINGDFNERPSLQEPEVTLFFDQPLPGFIDELAYEHRLLSIINELCNLLDELP